MRSGSETEWLSEAFTADITQIAQWRPPSWSGCFRSWPSTQCTTQQKGTDLLFFFKESFAACCEASNRAVDLKKWEFFFFLIKLFNMSGYTSPSWKQASLPYGLRGDRTKARASACRPSSCGSHRSGCVPGHGDSVFRSLPS